MKMTNKHANPILKRYAERLMCASVAVAPRPAFDLSQFHDDYYAPSGYRERLGGELFARMYRVTEIVAMGVDTGQPQMIDHHIGNAYWKAMMFADRGYCIHFVPGDNLRIVCETVIQYPESLRNRIDAVLEGLRIEADPDGRYEGRFMNWQADWYSSMRAAVAMTENLPAKTKYRERLRLIRNAAKDLFPELIEWFDDIRMEVCAGGHTAAWGSGDELR